MELQASGVALVAILAGAGSGVLGWLPAIGLAACVLLSLAVQLALGRAVFLLAEDQQLRLELLTGKQVRNGPGIQIVSPLTYRSAEVVQAVTLGSLEYVRVRSAKDGSERVVKGPQLLFLGEFDEKVGSVQVALTCSDSEYLKVEDKLSGKREVRRGPLVFFPGPHDTAQVLAPHSLTKTEYLVVEDKLSGQQRTVKGPVVFVPGAYDEVLSAKQAIALQKDEYVRLKDSLTGRQWCEQGEQLLFLEPTWQQGEVKKAIVLKANEFVRFVDSNTGAVVVHRGEASVVPGPTEELADGKKLVAVELKVQEFIKVLDQTTGEIRVERGPAVVYLGPNDRYLSTGKKDSIEVDDEHAVLVRDKSTGQLRLVTEKQLFFPSANEQIEEVREKISLADHEAVMVKDQHGNYAYHYGNAEKAAAAGTPRSFFLQPHCELVTLLWSRGRRRERRDLRIQRFDTRAQYMSFEFNCRTSDNVELVLEGTFFWQVTSLPLMMATTGDAPGDICNHARSQFIRYVSRVTLKEFMEELHAIGHKVHNDDKGFYEQRGIAINSLEVTGYRCADPSTSQILEQIIQETTNRMNRLSQAESESEVKLFAMQGQIEQEQLMTELLTIQHEHDQLGAKTTGECEADKALAFFDGLGACVPKVEDRLKMWSMLRKADAVAGVSHGSAQVYFTPSDTKLTIEAR